MREIKFRGKDKKNWHYGDLIQEIRHNDNKLFDGTVVHIKNLEYKNGEYIGNTFPVNSETIGQYTGLKDKNGTEIYEGDIFEVIDSHEERFIVWVEYSEKYAEFVIRHSSNIVIDNEPLGDTNTEETVIILGNIHDNPELLEVR